MLEWLVVLSLVAWRLSSLVYNESLLDGLRERLGIVYDEHDELVMYPDGWWVKHLTCFWCLTLWVSLLVTAVATAALGKGVAWGAVMWLGTAAGALCVEKWVGRTKRLW